VAFKGFPDTMMIMRRVEKLIEKLDELEHQNVI